MAVRVSCVNGERLELTIDDVWVWTDERHCGYGYWCPRCQVAHTMPTQDGTAMLLIDTGARVEDVELFGAG